MGKVATSECSTATNSVISDQPKPVMSKIQQQIAAINNANSKFGQKNQTEVEENTWEKFVNVIYSRNSMRKQTVKNDGYLVIGSLYTILVTDESKQLAKGTNKLLRDLNVGDKFAMESYKGELLEDLPISQFTSGNCFLNLQANVNKREATQKKLGGKKGEEEPVPFAPMNGVDLSSI